MMNIFDRIRQEFLNWKLMKLKMLQCNVYWKVMRNENKQEKYTYF